MTKHVEIKVQSTPSLLKSKQAWAICMAILLLTVTLLSIDEMAVSAELHNEVLEEEVLPVTTYIDVTPSTYQAKITVLGETVPRWNTPIRSFVRGEVTYISPSLIEGAAVKKGDLLLTIQDSAYQAAVDVANKALQQAKLQLLQAKRNSQQARKNWQRADINGTPDSPLTFKEPQLTVAEGELTAAESSLENAKTLLQYTRLTAPYDGVILSRKVNPGEFIESGQLLFQMMDTLTLDIPVMLNHKQWQQLTPDWLNSSAAISSVNRPLQWMATVQRQGGYIDKSTRLRQLYLSYQQTPSQANKLLPGEFVKVHLPGRSYDNLLKLPQSAYTRDQIIWYLTVEDELKRYRTKPVFADDDYFYFKPPVAAEKTSSMRVVLYPLSSFVPGMQVQGLSFADSKKIESVNSRFVSRQTVGAF